MKLTKAFPILCAAAIVLTASSCRSPESAENTAPPASETVPAVITEATSAAETATEPTTPPPAAEISSAAHEPEVTTVVSSAAEVTTLTEIDGEEYVVAYTSSQGETSAPAETTATVVETSDPSAGTTAAPETIKPTLDDIGMFIESDGDITPDTQNITLYVDYIGKSDTAIFMTGNPFRLQKYAGVKWSDVPFAPHKMIFTEIGLILSAESKEHKFTIPLDDSFYQQPITSGTYRIIKNISGVDFAEQFVVTETAPAVPGVNDIAMKIEHDGEITVKSGVTSLKITYTGSYVNAAYYTDDEFVLEKYTDGKWTEIPFSDEMCFEDIALEIGTYSKEQTIDVTLDRENYAEPLTAGRYRAAKDIGGARFYAEFDITDASPALPDGDMTVINENGSITLDIYEIKPDEFVCYNYIPLPGTYHVLCDTSKYGGFCVGDRIDVSYSTLSASTDNVTDDLYLVPESITQSTAQLDPDVDYKPVIYLYPEKTEEVIVKLDYNGRLTVTDPEYKDGWTVTASPDGTLTCEGREYPYLFWEGKRSYELTFDEGFCVSGADTERFLIEKLAFLGLSDKETADFLEFWLPFMRGNAYNIISFAGTQYTDNAKLDITPAPDTVIRVYMQFKASDTPVDIPEQELAPAPARTGFTAVEWGGSVTQ